MREGLIPAHAGKTAPGPISHTSRRAHPRSRGENAMLRVRLSLVSGSSPLTRGKRPTQQPRPALRGLIPAHAGKTRAGRLSSRSPGAHPRSRGENHDAPASSRREYGSSPLTRGKLQRQGQTHPVVGLIPAHAGKTRPWPPATRPTRAHPRSRGENAQVRAVVVRHLGSSPLTRGKPLGGGVRARGDRLIPAHAGKTDDRLEGAAHPRAHPRSRGENSAAPVSAATNAGSSPLTRGKQIHVSRQTQI